MHEGLLWHDSSYLPETGNTGESKMLQAFLLKHGAKYGCPISPPLSNVVPEILLEKKK